jgi:hypothetical protein
MRLIDEIEQDMRNGNWEGVSTGLPERIKAALEAAEEMEKEILSAKFAVDSFNLFEGFSAKTAAYKFRAANEK